MRKLTCLICLLAFAPMTRADRSADEKKAVERIEKVGATVRVDESLPATARLKVSFARLDDKAAIALKGSVQIGSLTIEDASKLTDRGLSILATLTGLRELTLIRPAVTNAGLSNLKSLKELRKLYLMDAKISDLSAVKGLTKLEELDVSGTAITSAAASNIKSLADLQLLAVSKTKFGDAGVEQLHELTHLKVLDAVNSDVSVKGAVALEKAIPKVRVRR